MHGMGIAGPAAERLAAAQDEQMGRGILTLYRSAAQPALARAGRHLSAAAARPGLVLCAGADDMTGTEAMFRHVAEVADAKLAVLDGVGHWWMVEDPLQGARTLTAFRSSLVEAHRRHRPVAGGSTTVNRGPIGPRLTVPATTLGAAAWRRSVRTSRRRTECGTTVGTLVPTTGSGLVRAREPA